jgi:hypothetical protein
VPGQLLQASLTSQKFVPLLRLYDAHGTLVSTSGDDADALVGRVTHMVVSGGTFRLQVSSIGDGGGGEFRQAIQEATVAELKVGERGRGTLQPGATDFRVFEGKELRSTRPSASAAPTAYSWPPTTGGVARPGAYSRSNCPRRGGTRCGSRRVAGRESTRCDSSTAIELPRHMGVRGGFPVPATRGGGLRPSRPSPCAPPSAGKRPRVPPRTRTALRRSGWR